ncbi:hypothetical protein D3C71_2200690 [compost metagenome]
MPSKMQMLPRMSGKPCGWPSAGAGADGSPDLAEIAISTPVSASRPPSAAGKNPGPMWLSDPM